MRALRFGNHQKARGLLVQPVYDPGPLSPARGQRSPASTQEGVDEGSAPVAGCRVDDHAGRLVNDEQRLVLVDDRERDVLARDVPFLDRGNIHPHPLASLRPVARLFPAAIDGDVPVCDQRGGLRARKLRALGDKQIEANIAVRLYQELQNAAQL